jgi:glycosyltransferase involved in cell wall biosynthesis
MNPTISIIIPVYNSEPFLHQCLDSIVNQTLRDIEIICVNDSSTDNSLKILEEYSANDVRVKVYTKVNEGKGAASARNLGLENACGKYLMFLDSDDFFELEMLEKLSKQAEKTDADIVICRAMRFCNETQKITSPYASIRIEWAPPKNVFSYKDCPERIFQIGDVIAWNKMFRKTLIGKYDLRFEEFNISDDQYLPAIAMAMAERISVIDHPFVIYRYNTSSSQSANYTKYPQSAYIACFSIIDRLKKLKRFEEVRQSYYNMILAAMRVFYDSMENYNAFAFLHNKLKNEIFAELRIEDLPKEFFLDERLYDWCQCIIKYSAEEMLFHTARAYNAPFTTGILRFGLPPEKLKNQNEQTIFNPQSIESRYVCAQLILSGNSDRIQWRESK